MADLRSSILGTLSKSNLLYIAEFLGLGDLVTLGGCCKQLAEYASFEPLYLKFIKSEEQKSGCTHLSSDSEGWKGVLKSWSAVDRWNWSTTLTFSAPEAVPEPRYLHRIARGSQPDTMYLFGGAGPEHCYGDLWKFQKRGDAIASEKVSEWAPGRPRELPPPRYAATFVACGTELFLFGGGTSAAGQFFDDLWCFDEILQKWSCCKTFYEIRPSERALVEQDEQNYANDSERAAALEAMKELTRPDMRWAHSMVTFEEKMYLFGGSAPGGLNYNDLWVLKKQAAGDRCADGKPMVWEAVELEGDVPEQRCGHAAAIYDGVLYIQGGNVQNQTFGCTYCVPLGGGGGSGPRAFQKIEVLEGSQEPAPRIGHAMVALARKLLVYGGRDIHSRQYRPLIDVCHLGSCSTAPPGAEEEEEEEEEEEGPRPPRLWARWEQLDLSPGPPGARSPLARSGHGAALFAGGLLVFGGLVQGGGEEEEEGAAAAAAESLAADLHLLAFAPPAAAAAAAAPGARSERGGAPRPAAAAAAAAAGEAAGYCALS